MAKKVVVLGGGVAGMSVAQELSERGFNVEVYELNKIPGGKARSLPVENSGTCGRKDLPAEHGFRFFPSFYRHLFHTMKRIRDEATGKTVYDQLTPTSRTRISRNDGREDFITPIRFPQTIGDLRDGLIALAKFQQTFGLPVSEITFYMGRFLIFITSCDKRRLGEYENMSWWDFIRAKDRSDNYKNFFAVATRSLVAADAQQMSARTGGTTNFQLQFGLFDTATPVDQVLNGPTNDVWIEPWLRHLKQHDVQYCPEAEVQAIECAGKQITGVIIDRHGKVTADYYVAAMPVEKMRGLLNEALLKADPALVSLYDLKVDWMNGFLLYLHTDVSLVTGHTLYFDSPWALTSISQRQFWKNVDLGQYGNGRVGGILSLCISDWHSPGVVYNQPADQCSLDEIKREVIVQLQQHLNDTGKKELEESNIERCFLDPAISFPGSPPKPCNSEPLLINTKRSWWCRPEATTQICNLFLAADYVRTFTDIATMESANEAARRAANGILTAAGQPANCDVWCLREPPFLNPFKDWDCRAFEWGLPHPLEILLEQRWPEIFKEETRPEAQKPIFPPGFDPIIFKPLLDILADIKEKLE